MLAAAAVAIVAMLAVAIASTTVHAASSGASSSPQPLFSTAAAAAAAASPTPNSQLLSRLRSHTLATPTPRGNHATLGAHASEGFFPPSYSFKISALDKEFEIRLKKNSDIIDKKGYQHIK
jgi:hypothetical protein